MLTGRITSSVLRTLVVAATAAVITTLLGLWEYSAELEAIQVTPTPADVASGWLNTERMRWLQLCLAMFAAAAACNAGFEWRNRVHGATITLTSTSALAALVSVLWFSVVYVGALPELRWMENNGCCVHGPLFARHAPLLAGAPALLLGLFLRKKSATTRRVADER